MFFLFPALAVMLGWGLRGHIGGGPFGAMIPGAMLALSISLLLKIPEAAAAVILVLGVFGIGLGGEMTYGQTLGFLRDPDTVWWGLLGITLKGGVWGLLGGTVISTGLIFHRLSKKAVVAAFLIMMAGMVIGFKGINEPMRIYFSDPVNPRSESWAALLSGAVTLLVFLRFKAKGAGFHIVSRFALMGLIGGGLGFGLGSLWMVLGSHLPDVIFSNWWKAMEFTFGFILGGSLGYAAWQHRQELRRDFRSQRDRKFAFLPTKYTELGLILVIALLVHWLIPKTLEPFVEAGSGSDGFFLASLRMVARIMVNYAFYGFLFVLFLMRFPGIAWQTGITLTFCHAVIDLVRDFFPDINTWSPFTWHFLTVFSVTAVFALLVARISREKQAVSKLFLLLIWSCVVVSLMRLSIHPGKLFPEAFSFCELICRRYLVDLFFVVAATVLSLLIAKKFNLADG